MVIERRIHDIPVESGRLHTADPSLCRDPCRSDMHRDICPCKTRIRGDLKVAVIGTDPDDARVDGGFRNAEYRGMVLR